MFLSKNGDNVYIKYYVFVQKSRNEFVTFVRILHFQTTTIQCFYYIVHVCLLQIYIFHPNPLLIQAVRSLFIGHTNRLCTSSMRSANDKR